MVQIWLLMFCTFVYENKSPFQKRAIQKYMVVHKFRLYVTGGAHKKDHLDFKTKLISIAKIGSNILLRIPIRICFNEQWSYKALRSYVYFFFHSDSFNCILVLAKISDFNSFFKQKPFFFSNTSGLQLKRNCWKTQKIQNTTEKSLNSF